MFGAGDDVSSFGLMFVFTRLGSTKKHLGSRWTINCVESFHEDLRKCNFHSLPERDQAAEYKIIGSCVLKASVDRVSVDTLDRYVDRQSADMSTEYRPICRPSIGRHVVRVNRPSVDTIGRYVGRHSADISADMSLVYRSIVGGVSVDCRWCIGRLSVVSEYC